MKIYKKDINTILLFSREELTNILWYFSLEKQNFCNSFLELKSKSIDERNRYLESIKIDVNIYKEAIEVISGLDLSIYYKLINQENEIGFQIKDEYNKDNLHFVWGYDSFKKILKEDHEVDFYLKLDNVDGFYGYQLKRYRKDFSIYELKKEVIGNCEKYNDNNLNYLYIPQYFDVRDVDLDILKNLNIELKKENIKSGKIIFSFNFKNEGDVLTEVYPDFKKTSGKNIKEEFEKLMLNCPEYLKYRDTL